MPARHFLWPGGSRGSQHLGRAVLLTSASRESSHGPCSTEGPLLPARGHPSAFLLKATAAFSLAGAEKSPTDPQINPPFFSTTHILGRVTEIKAQSSKTRISSQSVAAFQKLHAMGLGGFLPQFSQLLGNLYPKETWPGAATELSSPESKALEVLQVQK